MLFSQDISHGSKALEDLGVKAETGFGQFLYNWADCS